jgi:hypothetical protein
LHHQDRLFLHRILPHRHRYIWPRLYRQRLLFLLHRFSAFWEARED